VNPTTITTERSQPATLSEFLLAAKSTHAALIVPEDEAVLTFGSLRRRVASVAVRLEAAHVRRGDRVAIVLPNGPEYLEALLAVMVSGAAAAPLNPSYKTSEFESYLDDIAPSAIILPVAGAESARAALNAAVATVEIAVRTPGGNPGVELSDSKLDGLCVAEPDDVALLLHTSGTTSRPKLVTLLHRNISAGIQTIANHYELQDSDVSYCAMPLVHVHGLIGSTFAAWKAGGTVVVPRRFTPSAFPAHARHYGVTWLSGSPTVHLRILDAGDLSGVQSLRFVRSCSSALPPAMMERMEAEYSVPVIEAYGMTEASHQVSSNPLPPRARHAGAVGIATGTQVKIVSPDGRDAAEGVEGEVLIRGPGITPGYTDPVANDAAFSDGWFRTGDLGSLADGVLQLRGRLKEIIVRGGENISPIEIESVLLEHRHVVDVACFGVPDAVYGEQVGAALVLDVPTPERELIEHCRQSLADFKLPRMIHIVSDLPRTSTGKLRRRDLAVHFGSAEDPR
jgi:acyl-CoA synthetase (AMP-forming)/AMP-acid ligase II